MESDELRNFTFIIVTVNSISDVFTQLMDRVTLCHYRLSDPYSGEATLIGFLHYKHYFRHLDISRSWAAEVGTLTIINLMSNLPQ